MSLSLETGPGLPQREALRHPQAETASPSPERIALPPTPEQRAQAEREAEAHKAADTLKLDRTRAELNGILDSELTFAPLDPDTTLTNTRVPQREALPTLTSETEEQDFSAGPSWMRRLGKNKLARGVFAALNLLGVGQKLESFSQEYVDKGHQEAAQEQISTIAYGSALDIGDGTDFHFEHRPDVDPGLKLEPASQRLTHSLQVGLEGRLNGFMEHLTDTKLSDGQAGVDILKFFTIYGDQLPLPGGDGDHTSLEQATGLSGNELEAYAEIMRESLFEKQKGGSGRVIKMEYHGIGDFNGKDYHGDKFDLYQHRVDQAGEIVREALQTIDFDTLPPEAQETVKTKLETALRSTVDADNALTKAVNVTENWSTSHQNFEDAPRPDDPKQGITLAEILEKDSAANLAWKSVAALDGASSGHLHDLANAVTGNLEHKGHGVFSTALNIDPDAAVFKTGLEHFSAASPTEVAHNP